MSKTFETDNRTIWKFWLTPVAIMLVILFIYKAATGLILIGVSIFLALALKPLVRKVNELFIKMFGTTKKHQSASVVLAFLIVVTVIVGVLLIVGPVIINESSRFIQNFPETFEKSFGGWDGINEFGKHIGINDLHAEITTAIDGLSNNLFGVIGNNIVSGVSNVADVVTKVALALVLALLFLLEGPAMMNSLWAALGSNEEDKKASRLFKRIISKMANVVSTYVSRQVLVAIIDGCASGLIVFLLSLFMGFSSSLAIPMGMITMTFFLIPMFGQFIGGTLVTLILFVSSPIAAIIFAVVYIIYAQIENNVISPKIQGSALNLPAVMILCAVTIGMYMFGLLGAIIAIPIAGCIRVLISEYPNIRALRK